ncbi:MAG: cytochrome-c peroxidase [Candidatus Sericytochromatia bacterium]
MVTSRTFFLGLSLTLLLGCQTQTQPVQVAGRAIPSAVSHPAAQTQTLRPVRLGVQIAIPRSSRSFQIQQAAAGAVQWVRLKVSNLAGDSLLPETDFIPVLGPTVAHALVLPANDELSFVEVTFYDAAKQPVATPLSGYFRPAFYSKHKLPVEIHWLNTPVVQTLKALFLLNPELARSIKELDLQERINRFVIHPLTRQFLRFPTAIRADVLAAQIQAQGQLPEQLDTSVYQASSIKLRVSGLPAGQTAKLKIPALNWEKTLPYDTVLPIDLPAGTWELETEVPTSVFGFLSAAKVTLVAGQSAYLQLPLVAGSVANPINQGKVELGARLFFEKALSGNNQMSCATCHDPRKGFSNGEANAVGIDGIRGTRNVPALFELASQPAFFHDGRTATLEEQALEPIQNPIEMHETLPQAMADLQAIPYYPSKFQAVFGSGISAEGIAQALASFQRALVLYDSAYDKRFYVSGVFSPAMLRGYQLFNGTANCTLCHKLPHFSDFAYRNVGIGMDQAQPDPGRQAVTQLLEDTGKFKTPTLRNISASAPYMHDGSLATLSDVLDYYIRGGNANPHLDANKVPLNLTAEQKADLLAFLESLTGQNNLKQLLDLPGTKLPDETLDLPALE